MVFRYKWNPKFSEIFCNNIVRGAVGIRRLEEELPTVSEEMTQKEGGVYLTHIDLMLDFLDLIIFSTSSLLYREEKTLMTFGKKVQGACAWLLKRVDKDKRNLSKDGAKLEKLMRQAKARKAKVKRLGRTVKKDEEVLGKDTKRYGAYLDTLAETVEHIEKVAEKIHGLDTIGKAQKRDVLSPAYIKERMSVRTNYGLVTLIRREAIEVDQAVKGIARKVKALRKILRKKGKLDGEDEKQLFKLVEIEAKDIELIFEHALTVKGRLHSHLSRFSRGALALGLGARHQKVRKHYHELTDEIRTQQKRMSNEFESIDIKKSKAGKVIRHDFSKKRAA